jgi:hypothetical protein
LHNQALKKVIVAVPEKSIRASFESTELKKFVFLQIGNPMLNIIFVMRVLIKAGENNF